MRYLGVLLIIASLFSCNSSEEKKEISKITVKTVKAPVLNLQEANRLSQLPIHCMDTEYPNRLGQT